MESCHKSAISDAQAAIIRSVVLASPSPVPNEGLLEVVGDPDLSDPFVANGGNESFLRDRWRELVEHWERWEPIDDDDGLPETGARADG